MIWNVDPVAFTLGPLAVHWYGLLFGAGFFAGLRIMIRIYVREGRDPAELDSLFGYVVAGVLIGARLGHCLFYDPAYYLTHPQDILKIWEGGLASHGGAVGLMTAVWLFLRRADGPDLSWLFDRLAIPAALGGACIRLGNFMNSEIVGLPSAVPWAVVFTRVDGLPRHPVQLYEALVYALIFGVLLGAYHKGAGQRPGRLTGWFLLLVFAARFALEFFKTPQAAYEQDFALTVGQWLSLPCIVAGAWLVIRKSVRS
jgi:phosphatidylglycerol:prolipoprotein diacylglycerol transferase